MDSVLQLLDELEEVLDSSKAVPFSNKVSVDKEETNMGDYGIYVENATTDTIWGRAIIKFTW